MFIKYEKSHKKILQYYHQTGERVFPSQNISVPLNEIEHLAAHGLLEITPYVQDIHYRVKITDRGLIHFDLKHDKAIRFWIPVAISLIALLRPEIEKFIYTIIELFQKNDLTKAAMDITQGIHQYFS